MITEQIAAIADRVIEGHPLTRAEVETLIAVETPHLHDLFRQATRIREHFHGNKVRCCSIVSSKTGKCSEDCAFCSQSAHFETHVQGLSTLDPQAVLKAAAEAAVNGADSFGLVNSGLGPTDKEIEHWGPVVQQIRRSENTRACGSLGVLKEGQAERLAELGMQRYNHNLQTSRRHFPNIIKTHSYDQRLETMKRVKAAGISLCSGALFGMGETWADRLDLAFELIDIQPDVVPLNFLIPIDGTPLAGSEPLAPMECLKIIAIYRFCLPTQEIKIAGGRETNLGDLQSWIFYAGANSFLIGNYLTTFGRSADDDRRMVRDLGLELVEYGGETYQEPAGIDLDESITQQASTGCIPLPIAQ